MYFSSHSGFNLNSSKMHFGIGRGKSSNQPEDRPVTIRTIKEPSTQTGGGSNGTGGGGRGGITRIAASPGDDDDDSNTPLSREQEDKIRAQLGDTARQIEEQQPDKLKKASDQMRQRSRNGKTNIYIEGPDGKLVPQPEPEPGPFQVMYGENGEFRVEKNPAKPAQVTPEGWTLTGKECRPFEAEYQGGGIVKAMKGKGYLKPGYDPQVAAQTVRASTVRLLEKKSNNPLLLTALKAGYGGMRTLYNFTGDVVGRPFSKAILDYPTGNPITNMFIERCVNGFEATLYGNPTPEGKELRRALRKFVPKSKEKPVERRIVRAFMKVGKNRRRAPQTLNTLG